MIEQSSLDLRDTSVSTILKALEERVLFPRNEAGTKIKFFKWNVAGTKCQYLKNEKRNEFVPFPVPF